MRTLIIATALALSAPAALACETFTVGDLTVEHAWSRATIGAATGFVLRILAGSFGHTQMHPS